MPWSIAIIVGALVLFNGIFYLWWVDRCMRQVPAEVSKLVAKRWTSEDIRIAYQQVQEAPTDVRPFLFPRRGRRYIVTGGSGLVGGWIVKHLLMRGEDPAAIRILDVKRPTRSEVTESRVQFVESDVSDATAVSKAFETPWNSEVAKSPLTVFHTVAYIHAGDRAPDFWNKFQKVNVDGTANVLDAAKAAGASCFIATSSGSVGIAPVHYFLPPWKSMPKNYVQILDNADPPVPNPKLSDLTGCYAYSKHLAEQLVRNANQPGFNTGAVRPGHSIYGSGVSNPSSSLYNYLSRGGLPVWTLHGITKLVSAQNVSVAHLAFENTLLNNPESLAGGQAYACTDPGPPISNRDLFSLLTTLAHPIKRVRFPEIPSVPILLVCYLSEAYQLLQHRYLRFLPRATGDLTLLQPAMMSMASLHIIYDDSRAKKEIGYRPPITTLEGLCDQVLYFNRLVEADLKRKVMIDNGKEMASARENRVLVPS